MKGYLTDIQIKKIENLKFQSLVDVYFHYWIKEDFQSLDWIEFIFNSGKKLGLTSGDIAEDISVVDYSKHSMSFQGEYELRSERVTMSESWRDFKDQVLLEYEVTDNGYCNGSIIFQFGNKKVEVIAGIDYVKAIFL